MVATTNSHDVDPSSSDCQPGDLERNISDESLSWQEASLTAMTDVEYHRALVSASVDQKIIIDKVYNHQKSVLNGDTTDQLLLFVTGGAGVGKSFLIHTIKEMLIRNQHSHNPVLLTAPTGIAAYNIGGVTIHSAFCLPVEHHKTGTYVPLKAEKMNQFRTKFRNIAYIIIDKISMVSVHNFSYIHKRLCEIKGTTDDSTVIFGGLSVLVFGDLFQLKPVHGSYIFDTRHPESYLWQQFDVSFLTTNHRQADDRTWACILNRIRTGEPTNDDIEVLRQRTLVDTSVPPFDTALRVFPTRKQVKEYNEHRLSILVTSSIYTITAIDTLTSSPGHLSDKQIQQSKPNNESETAGLQETLNLAQGSHVMLIRNVYTDEGLVNDAQGTVEDIEWGDESTTMPRGICVKFDNPIIGRSLKYPLDHEHHEAILIRPITANFFGKLNVHWCRTQIPLTPCWATTVHKVQGITLPHAVVDIGSKVFTSGMSYVALSSVQNIQGLAIEAFDHTKLTASKTALTEMCRLRTSSTVAMEAN